MKEQKFHAGDLVQVADDLGPAMSHFEAGCRAIVLYSYADRYGGSDVENYGLWLEGYGECSWYEEHQLTLIEHGRHDLVEQWRREELERNEKAADLPAVFASWNERFKGGSVPVATVVALAACAGVTESQLWGSRGEGFCFYMNARAVLDEARPFLERNDLPGWLARAEELKAKWRKP